VNILTNEKDQLRAGWRLLFFLVALVGTVVVAAALASIVRFGQTPLGLVWVAVLQLLSIGTATALAARVTERRSFGDVGFGLRPGWARELAYGTAFGVALLGIAVLPAAVAGSLELRPGAPDLSLAVAVVFFAVAAAYEELLCRGFPLQALASGIGRASAAILMSAIFAWLHGTNPNVTYAALGVTFVAGILLSIAYFRTRSLWLATGLHFGWNFAMGYLLGLPVSGQRLFEQAPLFAGNLGEPEWLTGGLYGPEGGVAALAAITIGCVVLAFVPVPNAQARVRPEA
jgi:membrane protease YdiL (CAAX protease family)